MNRRSFLKGMFAAAAVAAVPAVVPAAAAKVVEEEDRYAYPRVRGKPLTVRVGALPSPTWRKL